MKDIARFLSGFKSFQRTYFCGDNQLYTQLSQAQHPKVLVIACSDSRVDPAILLGVEPGDIFVVRNVANLVPPYETSPGQHGVSAALEYSIKSLKVEHVIVLGHSHCGGIEALMAPNRDELGEFIAPWVTIAEPALRGVSSSLTGKTDALCHRACEQAALLVSLENLLTFPWLRERVNDGSVYLHGWYFDMEKGELLAYMAETGAFEPLVPRCDLTQK